ncbi:hypothetical protein H4R22_001946 [Coemansia sp. RSA 1290]|nr:hypothetical protein H4R22_001946 [Coemansia sp. RSA 1290]KAJ2649733.1 hypothetical protein IWW40_002909 [Coemansia sp. RSA 1250]
MQRSVSDTDKSGTALDRRLPFDILCRIFVLAQWPSLAFVSRAFYSVSQSMAVRAHFYLAEFGRDRVLDGHLGLASRRPRMLRQDVVLMLLNLGADPCADGQWVLRHACARAWIPIVRKLLAMRQRPHAKAPDSQQPALLENWRGSATTNGTAKPPPLLLDIHEDDDAALRIAAGLGHVAVVQLLLDAGADAEAAEGEPLALAAGNGHVQVVRLLLERGASARSSHSRALRAAVMTGDASIACIEELLAYGADMHVMNNSCLLAACYRGDGEFPLPPPLLLPVSGTAEDRGSSMRAQLLQYSYAGVPSTGALYTTPAVLATTPMLPQARHHIRRYRNTAGLSAAPATQPQSPAQTACSTAASPTPALSSGAHETVNMDALVTAPGPTAFPADLQHAPPFPVTHIGVVRLLLARGVSPDAQNGRPLVYASSKGWARTAAVLLAYGASVHVRDNEPLREAAEHGHLALVRLLVAAGADIHADNDAPLRNAARGGHLGVLKELVAQGACVQGESGVLALRAAARGGWTQVVQELVQAGADSSDAEFRVCAMRSRELCRVLGISNESTFNRFLYQ